jgi:hypothetical protein
MVDGEHNAICSPLPRPVIKFLIICFLAITSSAVSRVSPSAGTAQTANICETRLGCDAQLQPFVSFNFPIDFPPIISYLSSYYTAIFLYFPLFFPSIVFALGLPKHITKDASPPAAWPSHPCRYRNRSVLFLLLENPILDGKHPDKNNNKNRRALFCRKKLMRHKGLPWLH